MILTIVLSVPKFSASQKYTDSMNKAMRETILGIRVVKAFNLKDNQKINFDQSNEQLAKITTKAYKILGVVMPSIQSAVNIAIIIVLSYSSTDASKMIVIAPFINVLMSVLFALITMIMVLIQIARSIPSIKRIKEVLN
jgi:ATP-binding cassette subfamily B protein